MQQNFPHNSQLQQQRIGSNPQNSVWVFASAGSGKTKILIDRLLRLLLIGTSPAKILCLTYTKIAAAEMQNRINTELSQWVIIDDETLKQRLKNLIGTDPSQDLQNQARALLIKTLDEERPIKIQTIHSFCQSLLSTFPFEAQIPVNFDLLTDGQVAIALKNAQKKLLSEASLSKKKAEINREFSNNFGVKQERDESTDKLLKEFKLHEIVEEISGNINDKTLLELLEKLLAKKDKLFFLRDKFHTTEAVIAELAKILAVDQNLDEGQIFEKFWQKINQQKLHDLCASLRSSSSSKNQKYGAELSKFLANPIAKNFNFLQQALLTEDKSTGEVGLKKLYDKIDLTHAQFLSEFFEEITVYIQQISSFLILQHNSQLLRFVYRILDHYQEFKRQNCYLDYGDLILLAGKLLSNEQHQAFIKMKMDGSFDHILIDESQDTNSEQWQIIKALTDDFAIQDQISNKPRSIFVVGDEKQSIFSFQGADIATSGLVLQHFKQQIGDNFTEIALNLSFRSKSKILQAVDLVFADESRKKAICQIGIYQPHQSFRGDGGYVELWKPIKSSDQESKTANQNQNVVQEELAPKDFSWQLENFGFKASQEDFEIKDCQILAQLIANKICGWISSQKSIDGRQIGFSDIMILLPNKTNGLAQSLAIEFGRQKIPFSTIEKVKFSESLVVQDFLSCARFALLPEDDFNLACLLKSPFFNLNESELLDFCLQKNRQKISLFEALRGSKHWMRLNFIKKIADELSLFEFFHRLIFEPQSYESFILRMGNQVKTIIENFIFLLDEFCTNNNSELQLFLEFVEKTDPEIALDFGEKNAVRINTIHSAKGLQAPIVIMPDCLHDLARFVANTENLIWLENLPLWLSFGSKPNFLIKSLKNRRKQANFEEYLRLLYVAMTRAEDELYIGGFGNKKDENCWYEIMRIALQGLAVNSDLQNSIVAADEKTSFEAKSHLINALNDEQQPIKQQLSAPSHNPVETSEQNFAPSFLHKTTCELAANLNAGSKPKPIQETKFFKKEADENLVAAPEFTSVKAVRFEANSDKNLNWMGHQDGFDFGKIIHSLLELIGRNHRQNSDFVLEMIKILIAKQQISPLQKQELEKIIVNFLQSAFFQQIFKSEAAIKIACEVDLIASGESGRVDLLCEMADEILIIDYKSDEFLPETISQSYKNQISRYCRLAKKLFSQKRIRAAILWIRHGKLQEIESV